MLYLITLHWGACIQTLSWLSFFSPCLNQWVVKGDGHCEKRWMKKVEELNKFQSFSPFYFLLELLECSWDVGFPLGVYPWVLALPFLYPLAVHRNIIQKALVNGSLFSEAFFYLYLPKKKTDRWLILNSSSQFYSYLRKRPCFASLPPFPYTHQIWTRWSGDLITPKL